MRTIISGDLRPWEKVGPPDVKLRTPFMTAFTQGFRHPTTDKVYEFSQIDIGDYLVVLPITGDQKIVFISEWKQGVLKVCPQFPQKSLPVGANVDMVAREILLAETGYVAELIMRSDHVFNFLDSRSPSTYQIAFALNCKFEARNETVAASVSHVTEATVGEIWKMVDDGEFTEPSVLVALMIANRRGLL